MFAIGPASFGRFLGDRVQQETKERRMAVKPTTPGGTEPMTAEEKRKVSKSS